MATYQLYDRVWETTATTGTGTITLAGAKTGYQSFAVVGNTNTCPYCITDGTNWEVGYGVYTTSGTTLTRTVVTSSNSNALVSFGAGTKDVTLVMPAFLLSTFNPQYIPATIFNFRLTTLSGTAVTPLDRTAQGTLYLTPAQNIGGTVAGVGQLALYTGTFWQLFTSAEISLTLSISTTTNYDVFVYNNSGTLTLETVAWTNSTTRATVLDLQDGVLCKHGTLTHRYCGTIRGTGTNTTEDSAANRFVVNYYNRAWKKVEVIDSTSNYAISSTTYVQVGTNQINWLMCTGDYFVRTEGGSTMVSATSNNEVLVTIGSGTTTQATGAVPGYAYGGGAIGYSAIGTLCESPVAGLVNRYLLARVTANSSFIYGNAVADNGNIFMRALVQC